MIDLNADLGEGIGDEAGLIPWITSANVACALHAGDPVCIWRTLQACKRHQVRVGAHPGYADREQFGRRPRTRTPEELRAELLFQIRGLQAIAHECDLTLSHIKPHGALYHQIHADPASAEVLARIAAEMQLPVVCLPGGALFGLQAAFPVRLIREGFIDRGYAPGKLGLELLPRDATGASIDDPAENLNQALMLIETGRVETLCLHGDHPGAAERARWIRQELARRGHLPNVVI